VGGRGGKEDRKRGHVRVEETKAKPSGLFENRGTEVKDIGSYRTTEKDLQD
jgi:hypothetical protein